MPCAPCSSCAVLCMAGCRKLLPQKLVLAASFSARLLAEAIDNDQASLPAQPACCATCGLPCAELTNKPCGHAACENCWEAWAKVQLPLVKPDGRLRAKCLHRECLETVHTGLWESLLTQTSEVQTCIDLVNRADLEMGRLKKFAKVTRLGNMPIQAGPVVCPICQEHQIALLYSHQCALLFENECSCHAACEACWTRWINEQLDHCRSQRAGMVRCIGCTEFADGSLWKHACTQSPAVQELSNLLARRSCLQQNRLFPLCVQVNCPQTHCVGLGYLGYDTVMCFLCEHQWTPEGKVGEPPPNSEIEIVMGVAVKRCPMCFQYIEKNGGCDHMTCQHRGCGHQFWWSTLQPYRL